MSSTIPSMTRPDPGNPEVIPRIEPETRTGRGCVRITVLMTVGAPVAQALTVAWDAFL